MKYPSGEFSHPRYFASRANSGDANARIVNNTTKRFIDDLPPVGWIFRVQEIYAPGSLGVEVETVR
jgi:hypothetical protein